MTVFGNDPLDVLAPRRGWEPDWKDVLVRAGEYAPRSRLLSRRRLVVVLAVIAVVLVPLVAYGAANNWWFLGAGAPAPASAPVVVKEGDWSGHAWQLVAYPSTTDGLCMSITPKDSIPRGEGAALACAPIAGVPRTGETKSTPDMTVTFLSSGANAQLPAYIAGPVVDQAAEVEIKFTGGNTLRVPTFSAPDSLGRVRFYATQIPNVDAAFPAVEKLIGFDSDGDVVACLVPATARDGVSPLSDCR